MVRRPEKLTRLDLLMLEKGLAESRNVARSLVMTGRVTVNGQIIRKAGHKFSRDSEIGVSGPEHPYVGRGGMKLEHALRHFSLNVEGLTCMDVGSSTGGFTDCLLQNGADRVFAVDVGYGQLDWRLRNDNRVVVLERTNVRYLTQESVGEKVDLVTIDTSFISLKLVVPAVLRHLKPHGEIIALVKPQFEAGRGRAGKKGIVRDPEVHRQVLEDLQDFFTVDLGMDVAGTTPSPVLGAKGNREFIMLIRLSKQLNIV